MQLRKSEQTQRVERSKEDSQGNFQIKAGHAQVLELGVSHKQLSHCGKSNELNSDSSHIKSRFFFSSSSLVARVLRFSVRCDGFYECGDTLETERAHTRGHYTQMCASLLLHVRMHKLFTLVLKNTVKV